MSPTAELRSRILAFRNRLGAPTDTTLRMKTERLIRTLERAPTAATSRSIALVDWLKRCCDINPCNSAVCHACAATHQAKAMAKLETVWPSGIDLSTTNVIIKKLERFEGDLHAVKLRSIVRSLRRKLEEVGCQNIPIWGYVDVSFNSHSANKYSSHWLPHPHIVFPTVYADLIRTLAKTLDRGTSINRPMRIHKIKNWVEQVSYACKPTPIQRVDYPKESSAGRPSKYPLNKQQSVEFALWLAEHHPRDRHFWLRTDVALL